MPFLPPQRRAPRHAKYDAIHRALLTGLLSNVGAKSETHEYQAPRGVRFSIFPGSTLFTQKPRWLVAGELVETTKLYARVCADVQPQWIERAAAHLVERSYSEPRWDSRTASVVATEKVALFGLVLVPARTVRYGPINPRQARDLFIHHALVLGDFRSDAVFLRHNAQLVAEVEQLEARIRVRNLLADAATRFAFYDARLPRDITNGAQFETWRRRIEKTSPRLLHMNKADLLRADAPAITPENYPDKIEEAGGGLQLPLAYRYEPGEPADGLTLTIPVAALSQLDPHRYEWLVPGMLEEKIAAFLRALPGTLRRNFVPVPTWAKSATEALLRRGPELRGVSLREALADYLAGQTGVEVTPADLAEEALPPYLRMAFRIVDDGGNVLALARDLGQLQRKLAPHAAGVFATIYQREFSRDGTTGWDFGDLPDAITVQRFQMSIRAYPALVDQGETCGLRLFPSADTAAQAHRAGVRRLFRLDHRRDLKKLAAELPDFDRMALQFYALGTSDELREDLLTLILDRALLGDDPAPRTRAAYEAMCRAAAPRLHETAEAICALAGEILAEYHAVTLLIVDATEATAGAAADVHQQLAYLLAPHFLTTTAWNWLQHVPRYVAGARLRLEKLSAGGGAATQRDVQAAESVSPWWNRYLARRQQHDAVALREPELDLFRWMVEEFRISRFAQELGTLMPVSARRLEKQFDKVRK